VGTTTGLTDQQLCSFDEDGFLVFDHLVDADVVAELRTAYAEILDHAVDAPGDGMLGGITRQVMMACQAHPTFDKNPALEAGTAIAEQILGDKVFRLFDMLIYKPPGHPHETPWHQDMSYSGKPLAPAGVKIPLAVLQFWVALDDVDEENGCMHFLPGYHKQPLLEHKVASGDPDDSTRLLAFVDPERQVDLARTVAAPLPAGGCTVHSYGTPHFTPPNRSTDRPRRAYIFNLMSRTAARERYGSS
jgi:ectoine hydroxylase-related dioxygenase (phytanoyl-CoA dioxygenase family)